MSTVIVTGSSGLVGSEAARFFHQKGFDVVGIDNDMRAYFFGEQASVEWSTKRLVATLPRFRHEAIDVSLRLYFLLPEHADSPEVQAQLWERVQGWAATSDPERRVIDAATTEDGRVFVVFAPASRPA